MKIAIIFLNLAFIPTLFITYILIKIDCNPYSDTAFLRASAISYVLMWVLLLIVFGIGKLIEELKS